MRPRERTPASGGVQWARGAAVTAVAGLACTAALTWWLHSAEAARLASTLRAEAHARAEHLDADLRRAVEHAGVLASTMVAQPDADRVWLADFAAERSVQLTRGVQLVWAPRVRDVERTVHERAVTGEIGTAYAIQERAPMQGLARVPDGARPDYFPLRAIAPAFLDDVPYGLDFGSEARRAAALVAARDTGEAAATAPVRLSLGAKPIAAALVFHPVFAGGGRPADLDRRRAALRGFAIAVIRTQALADEAMSAFDYPLHYRLVDRTEGTPTVLAESLQERAIAGLPRVTIDLGAYGRQWRLDVGGGPAFLQAHRSRAEWYAGLLALACTVALTMFVAREGRRREAVERRVTERTAALALSEARQRAVMENLAEALVVADANGMIESVNPATEALFGWAAAELVGRNVAMLMPEAIRGGHDAAVRQCAPGSASRVMGRGRELVALRRDGTLVPIHAAVSRAGEGRDARFIAAMRDRTAEQRAAEATRERNLFLERIVAHVPLGLAVTDAELRVVAYNDEFVELCQLPAADFPFGTRLEAFLRFHAARGDLGPPEHAAAAVRERLAQAARGEGGRTERLQADGRVVEVDSHPVPGGGFVTTFADVTARREFETSLVQAREAAEATARAKTDFLAVMSHEIRTPMNAVLGFAEALLHTRLDAEQRDYAETLLRSGQSLLGLLNDILDYSKLDADRVVLEHAAFDPRDILAHLVALWSTPASEKGLVLTVRAEPGVPEALLGDAGRVTQILQNLVSNAVKFTALGTVRVTMRAAGSDGERTIVRMEVTDTGIGMSEEVARTLFQPFVQADASTTRRFGGTGLGLSICRSLAERMGGRIGVASRPGEGATFWCELPFVRTTRAALARPDAAPDNLLRLRGRVLVAEDNAVNRKVARAALRRLGVDVEEVDDGAAAVARCAAGDIDLVLMDMHMPVCDGIEATRRIRAAEGPTRRVPILALTANTAEEARRDCTAAGMDGYVSKPFAFADLAAALAPWLPADMTSLPATGPTPGPLADAPVQASAPAPAPPPVDARHLATVRAAMGEDFAELVEVFIASADELTHGLEAARASGDRSAFHRHAHTLKSSSGQLGATALAALARDLEAAATATLPADAAVRVRALRDEYERVRDWLAHHARDAATTP
jgi:PAS domain S-box-containing protein